MCAQAPSLPKGSSLSLTDKDVPGLDWGYRYPTLDPETRRAGIPSDARGRPADQLGSPCQPRGWAQPQPRSWSGGGEEVHPEDSASRWIRGGELTPTLVRAEGEHHKKKTRWFPGWNCAPRGCSQEVKPALEETTVAGQTQTTIKGRTPQRQREPGIPRGRVVPNYRVYHLQDPLMGLSK